MPFAGEAEEVFVYKPIDAFDRGGCLAGVWKPKTPITGDTLNVAVVIHGGAFTMGDYQDVPATDVKKLTDAGFFAVSIQHRLAPQSAVLKEAGEVY